MRRYFDRLAGRSRASARALGTRPRFLPAEGALDSAQPTEMGTENVLMRLRAPFHARWWWAARRSRAGALIRPPPPPATLGSMQSHSAVACHHDHLQHPTVLHPAGTPTDTPAGCRSERNSSAALQANYSNRTQHTQGRHKFHVLGDEDGIVRPAPGCHGGPGTSPQLHTRFTTARGAGAGCPAAPLAAGAPPRCGCP